MQFLHQSPVDHLGVQPLKGQEHNGEIRGTRRVDVLIVNVLGKGKDTAAEHLGGLLHLGFVPGVIGLHQGFIGVPGEFGVNGQVYPGAVLGGELHRVFHRVLAALFGDHVGLVLLRGQDFLQNGSQLDFSQNAPGLYVGQNLFQVSHPGGQVLHFAQALVYLFQPLAHQLEGLAHPLVQGFLELFVHQAPHVVQLLVVVLLQAFQPGFHGLAHGVQLFAAFL